MNYFSIANCANLVSGLFKFIVSEELTDFLHAGTNSCKLKGHCKFWGRCGQKWMWPVM